MRHHKEEETRRSSPAVPWQPFRCWHFIVSLLDGFHATCMCVCECWSVQLHVCAEWCTWVLLPDTLIAGFHRLQMCAWLCVCFLLSLPRTQCFGKSDWRCRWSISRLYLKLDNFHSHKLHGFNVSRRPLFLAVWRNSASKTTFRASKEAVNCAGTPKTKFLGEFAAIWRDPAIGSQI